MSIHAPLILDIEGHRLTDVDRRRLAHPHRTRTAQISTLIR